MGILWRLAAVGPGTLDLAVGLGQQRSVHCRLGPTAAGAWLAIILSTCGQAVAAEGIAGSSNGSPDRAPGAAPAADTAAGVPAAAASIEPPDLRRSGTMLGLSALAVVGGASGYPNDVAKIDNAAYYANTGVGLGGGGGLWLGWALADWVTFGLTASGGAVSTADDLVRFAGGGLKVDVFPAWSLGGLWQELGVSLEAGIALAVADAHGTSGEPLIESGGASHFAVGVFYEGIRAWQISMGPFAALDLVWSPSMLRPLGCLGWRAVYYSGP